MQALPGVEVPQRLSCGCIRSFEEALVVSKKYYACHCTHDSAPAVRVPRLRVAPGKRLCLRIISQEYLRALVGLITLGPGRVVFLTFFEPSRLAKIHRTTFE